MLITKVHTDPEFLRSSYYSKAQSTVHLSAGYYKMLTRKQKSSIFNLLSLDLDFYYHLFPREAGTHKVIMNLEN